MKKTLQILLFSAIGINSITLAASSKYQFTDLGTLGGQNSYAYAINNSGQIVGRADRSDSLGRAVLFDTSGQGENIDLGTLKGSNGESWATAINNLGQIVGHDYDANGNWRAVLFDATGGGNNISLGSLADDAASAEAVNDSGIIVGWSAAMPDANGYSTWHATQFGAAGIGSTDLGNDQRDNSLARCVNANGIVGATVSGKVMLYNLNRRSQQIVADTGGQTDSTTVMAISSSGRMAGCRVNSSDSHYHAILLKPEKNGAFSTVDLGIDSCAASINDKGVVVGYTIMPSGVWHAMMFDSTGKGANIDLNTLIDPNLGWELQNAFINDLGQICGFGRRPDGSIHAYMLAPIAAEKKPVAITASVLPATLNLSSSMAVVVTLHFPKSCNVNTINTSSMALNGLLQVRQVMISTKTNTLMAALTYRDLQYIVQFGKNELRFSGNFANGTKFLGKGTLTVKAKQ